jgi:hypothetical protein
VETPGPVCAGPSGPAHLRRAAPAPLRLTISRPTSRRPAHVDGPPPPWTRCRAWQLW